MPGRNLKTNVNTFITNQNLHSIYIIIYLIIKKNKFFKFEETGSYSGATTEYLSTIVLLNRHPLKNEAYLFICKLVDGYSEV